MRECLKCLENSWSFENLPDDFIRATCNMCGAPVEWENKKKIMQVGDPCRHCKTPLVWKSSRLSAKRERKAYHYCKWLKCTKCKAIYLLEEYKKFKSDPCDCIKTERFETPSVPVSARTFLIEV